MIPLQDYIKEIDISNNYYVNEEGVWQKIKNWFKGLFSFSKDDDEDYYDWFSGDNNSDKIKNARKLKGTEKNEYEEIVKANFKGKDCKIVPIKDEKVYKGIISPEGATPDEKTNTGFWKYIDQPFKNDKVELYHYAVCWIGAESKKKDSKAFLDYPALITFYRHGYNINILRMQILKEYDNILNYEDLIKLIEKNVPTLFRKAKYIQFAEKNDKDVYEKLINDCEFESEYNNKLETNIAYIKITKL
jgi:hypothetical protein